MDRKYYLGLDIGTSSVGWAVTDENYNLCKFRGKSMWGIRLFDEASTAADRRMKRSNRRRLQRRKQRIDLLQELFANEISKLDPTFFVRLNESRLYLEDKSTEFKHPLFNGDDYTDREFYKEYPTIYHLRKELIESSEPHDVRLVYLALHHILKNRGHFLIDGDISNAKSFHYAFENMMEQFADMLPYALYVSDSSQLEDIMTNKGIARSEKAKRMQAVLTVDESSVGKDELKKYKASCKEICNLLSGNTGDIRKIFVKDFELDDSSLKFKFSEAKYNEEIAPTLEEQIPEEMALISAIKALYDWSVLVDVLNNEEYFSCAKVKSYNCHQANLKQLKKVLKKYLDKKEYKAYFDGRKDGTNYSNYIGQVKTNGKTYRVKPCNEEDFYKNLVKILKGIEKKVSKTDKAAFEQLLWESENRTLLPVQRDRNNGIVPKQVHEEELNVILENASAYLAFLNIDDVDGYNAVLKIKAIFNYRIPYYVGPLSDRHRAEGANNWAVRKEDGYIYPWNISEKIDFEASNEQFILRMTNKCTYLVGEDVLPKQSLLYSRYMVLNEINNIRIRGHLISESLKKEIYRELFEKRKSVTGKMLLNYLRMNDKELVMSDLSGFDENFKSSLSSYLDFKNKVFGERIAEDHIVEICEDIIRWSTIYGDDKRMLLNVVKANYGSELSEEQLKAIRKLRFTGWGNFSRKFLQGVQGISKDTGVESSIIEAMWDTNDNLMQVLSSRYTFTETIKELNADVQGEIREISYDSLVKDLYTSPANKRAIWQTIEIVQEIVDVMKCQPDKIFVEMARGGEKEKKRTKSRKQQLIELYGACKKDTREWALLEEINGRPEHEFNSIKLFLYYTQMGMCAYTGEHINVDELMQSNSKWDRDHIYPQSKIKDDSLDNLVLVNKKINSEKSNDLIPSSIQRKMRPVWDSWLEMGLISKAKHTRLTRTQPFTSDELAGFVARQLVETRQSTKLVAELLERMYHDSSIVRVKAGLVSDFRKTPLNCLKSRRVNDYHHAKDAYLNIVVGNVYNTKFTNNPINWVREHKDDNWSINKVFYYNVPDAWVAPETEKDGYGKWHAKTNDDGDVITGTIDVVRATMRKNNVLYTEYTYCKKGQLFNETIYDKDKGSNIPLKKDLDPAKYGGYSSANTSYFAEIEFDGKKGERVKNIIGVPIYVANELKHNSNALLEYCENIKGMKNAVVLFDKIKFNSLISVDGFPMRVRGESGKKDLSFKSNMQLVVNKEVEEIIRTVEKIAEHDDNPAGLWTGKSISVDSLKMLYDLLADKLINGPYKGRPSNPADTIVGYSEKIVSIEKEKLISLLYRMLVLFRCDATTIVDLQVIGGSKSTGSMVVNRNTLGKRRTVLVNQSVTGLFENRIEL